MPALPVSTKITMRPVWARRQRRCYLQSPLERPTESEIQDAIRVIRDPDNMRLAPALFREAALIIKEASE